MNVKQYGIKISYSPINFPPLNGLANQSTLTTTEPLVILNNKLVLKITNILLITESDNNREHQILKAQSLYEIPVTDITNKEDLYEFYKDAAFNLFQGYLQAQKHIAIPFITIPAPEPIENYEHTLDYIYQFVQKR